MSGTQEIAERIGTVLRAAGHTVAVKRGGEVRSLTDVDAVIVGGALYATRWHRDARRFVLRHADSLRMLPTYFFSSGPLDDSAVHRDIPPTSQVARLMRLAGSQTHATFGGRLDGAHARGFIARAMVKNGKGVGDFRDDAQIVAWANRVATAIANAPPLRHDARFRHAGAMRAARIGLACLCAFTAVTAIVGGVGLMLEPRGGAAVWAPPLWLLDGTPFSTFFVPGLLLAGVVGLLNAVATIAVLRRIEAHDALAFVAGGALLCFIVVEMLLLNTVQWLHILYLVVGAATCGLAVFARVPAARATVLLRRAARQRA